MHTTYAPLTEPPMTPGDTWNESLLFPDRITGRPTRQLTSTGLYNETPTYHLNACFSADSNYLVFASAREGASAILRANVTTGELHTLAVTDGIGIGHATAALEQVAPYVAGSTLGGFTGNYLALLQPTNWVVAHVGRTLLAVHLHTAEKRILIPDCGLGYKFGNPIGSIDGRSVLITRSVAHPDVTRGNLRTSRSYFEACTQDFSGMPTTYLQVDIDTGQITEIFSEKTAGSNHVQPCPADANLLLIDRDLNPKFAHGGDAGQTSRAWLLDSRTQKLTEIRPHFENRFQIHTNWNHTGTRIYYHGKSFLENDNRHYIGVADTTGNILWEGHYPHFFYGHVSTHTTRETIITDGLISPDLVTALHYEDLVGGWPRIEILARHATEWDTLRGQYTHPHVHMSPNGKYISYNRGQRGRTDICVVEVGS